MNIVNFDQARRLKELGYDGPADYYYPWWSSCGKRKPKKEFYLTPTIPDALQWFRDVKGIPCAIEVRKTTKVNYRGVFLPFVEDRKHPKYCYRKNTEYCEGYPVAESALLDALLTYLEEKKEQNKTN